VTQDPGEVFEAIYEAGQTGLAGNLAVAIHDNQSNVVFGPTTLNIVELVVDGQPTGAYRAMLTAPATEGQYTINWSNDGSFDPQAGGGVEDLLVEESSLDLPSLGDAVAGIVCNAWTTTDDVLDCCTADIGSDLAVLEHAIVAASELLYLASGRRWPGLCSRTVKACEDDTCSCCVQELSRGYIVYPHDVDYWSRCTCSRSDRVKLAGYVSSITEVTIDGVVVDPSEYEVREHLWLVRIDGSIWPCSTEVTYVFGNAPPVSGQLAARVLACEITKSCTPGIECAIPNGVVSVTRQGISFERAPLARDSDGKWATGMLEVDLFLNITNPHGLTRRGISWSPASRYARPTAA
jgi:hypothetical protein